MKTKMPYEEALRDAERFMEFIAPHASRRLIGGSLRRRCAEVGDIEVIASPFAFYPDMFGGPSEEHTLDLADWSSVGTLLKGGHKYKQIQLSYSPLTVDLFIVTPPAQWGVISILRTGSAAFNKQLVTPKQYGGMLPAHLKMIDGAFYDRHGVLQETPEEKDVFKLFGRNYVPPVERSWK